MNIYVGVMLPHEVLVIYRNLFYCGAMLSCVVHIHINFLDTLLTRRRAKNRICAKKPWRSHRPYEIRAADHMFKIPARFHERPSDINCSRAETELR